MFTDQFGCWRFLDLWRSEGARPFAASEAAYLRGIVASTTAALRRTQANTFLPPPTHGKYPRWPVVLLLSRHLQLLAQTPDTEDYLRVLIPPDADRSPLPAIAHNVAAQQLLANEAGIDPEPAVGPRLPGRRAVAHASGGQNREHNDAGRK